MIADFASVMVDPPRVRVLGVDLLPLSLGHVLALRFLGSSFLWIEPQQADLSPTAFVCINSWRENMKYLRSPRLSAAMMRLWGFKTRRHDKKAASAVLHAYIAAQMELPEVKRQRGGVVKYLLSEWETRVFAHLRLLGYSDEAALDMPLARAHVLFCAQLEKDDAMTFKTRHDFAREDAMRDILERMERGDIAG
jgi:hypothetical protein